MTTYVAGKGKYFGEMTIEPGAAEDEFKTTTKLKSVKDGSTVTRTGTSLVYAGYSWRGKSKGSAAATGSPDDMNMETRETLWISPDQSWAEGRWFWGEYSFDAAARPFVYLVPANIRDKIFAHDLTDIRTDA